MFACLVCWKIQADILNNEKIMIYQILEMSGKILHTTIATYSEINTNH